MKYSSYLKKDEIAIFLLHGVIYNNNYRIRNYNRKHLEKNYFENIIIDLKNNGSPVSINDYLEYRKGKTIAEKPFILTFDDGFENNYSIAAPLLKKHKIPALFYLTTKFIDENSLSWIDKIELCIENYKPKKMQMPWKKIPYKLCDIKEEKKFLNDVRYIIKTSYKYNSEKIVQSVYSQCNATIINHSNADLDKKMNWQQVKEISDNNLFTIGAHTHTHQILSHLDSKNMRYEIENSINILKKKCNFKCIKHFSYPEGFNGSFNDKTINILKQNKIECSPTTVIGLNDINTDLFKLKRINII